MSDFLNRMKSAAKADLKTIVLPEGEDPRTIVAANKIIEEGLANIVILGNPDDINVPGATVIDPRNAEKHEEYAQKFAELRAKKGVTIEQARAQVMDATYFGTMMVKMGDADGLVSGACHSTADTLRPALQILKTAPGTKLVSAFFVMCTDTPQFGTDGTLIFADCGLNINPSSDELSEIAIASAHSWSTFMGNSLRNDFRKIRVFISSKCGDSEPGNLGRFDRMRREIAKRLDSSPVFAPYLWERGGASTANAERNYIGELNDSDICVVVIDNKVGVTPGVQKEVDQVIQTDKRALFYFVSEFSDASTLLQSQL